MRITFLGTGAGVPAKKRNVTGIALVMPEYGGDVWLFDCGEATQHQILHTNIKLSKMTAIFITHMHGDHVFGLPGLLSSRSFQGARDPLHIYGPKGIRAFVEQALKWSESHLSYELHIHEIEEGQIFADDRRLVSAAKLNHVVPSFGFRIEEKPKPGPLLVEKIKRDLGLEPGPIYKAFKTTDVLTLADGRRVHTADYIGTKKKGRSLAILGDTAPCSGALSLGQEASVLVHEGTFMSDKEVSANEFGHSTARQAAFAAKTARVDVLILTHISARYQDESALLDEARAVFPMTYIARDFWSYQL
ncbi:ribonuclease Z [Camelliibacillus cellulosilyticus]|uniref:Ribonuclease Z n=1 Tax=Camelliibacillus cellulosilyticus TaxID=2174486 RepID=A0ABV9GLX3_9BACL